MESRIVTSRKNVTKSLREKSEYALDLAIRSESVPRVSKGLYLNHFLGDW